MSEGPDRAVMARVAARVAERAEEAARRAREAAEAVALPSQPPVGPDRQVWQLRAALRHGIPEDHAGRLNGTTAEEVEADAAAFAEMIGRAGVAAPKLRSRPAPIAGSGGGVPEPADRRASLVAHMRGARRI
ncbi:hypothetical protein [Kitasatospora sp. NPDC088548]|uniref:hypothetical protein n=1 Tax=Kitasatospora sp. NPDC088548 TaxID=3364075 RepID=UPI00380EEE16